MYQNPHHPDLRKLRTLDVQSGNVLCTASVIDEPNEPVVEQELEIAGVKYTDLDRP